MNLNLIFEEKDQRYYMEVLKSEVSHNLEFYKADVRTHERNIDKLAGEIKDEERAIITAKTEIADIEARLNDPAEAAKKLLLRDFRSAISDILMGEDSQINRRFGLQVQHQGPFVIDKAYTTTENGKKVTKMYQASIIKKRNNEEALEGFRSYLRAGRNLSIEGLSFDQAKKAMEKFFRNAPDLMIYGKEYEQEQNPALQGVV